MTSSRPDPTPGCINQRPPLPVAYCLREVLSVTPPVIHKKIHELIAAVQAETLAELQAKKAEQETPNATSV